MFRLHCLRTLCGRGSLRHQRARIIFCEQVLCHVLHRLLILADLLVNVFDLARFDIAAAGTIILLNFLHFDGPSLVLLSRLPRTVRLELLAAAVGRQNLGVRSRTAVTALVLHELELLFLHQAAQKVIVAGRLWHV